MNIKKTTPVLDKNNRYLVSICTCAAPLAEIGEDRHNLYQMCDNMHRARATRSLPAVIAIDVYRRLAFVYFIQWYEKQAMYRRRIPRNQWVRGNGTRSGAPAVRAALVRRRARFI